LAQMRRLHELPGAFLAADELLAACNAYAQNLRCCRDIRFLVSTDLPAIEAINAVTYGGHDYIVAAFPTWLERQGKTAWAVGVEDGTGLLAGLEVLSLVDGGMTGWLEALRVHPRIRRCGVATYMQSHLVAFAMNKLRLARVRYNTATSNLASRRLAARCGLQEVASWGILTPRRKEPLTVLAARIRRAMSRDAKLGHQGAPVKASVLGTFAPQLVEFAQQAGHKFLLQSNWKNYDFALQNVEELLTSGLHEEPLVKTKSSCGSAVTSFSWAFRQRDAFGLTVFATIYAGELQETLSHICAQLNEAIEVAADYIMFMYAPTVEPELHRMGLVERCQTTLDGNLPVAKCVLLFERQFASE